MKNRAEVKPGPKYHVRPTPREIRVLEATADGCSLEVAADRLGIPSTTVGHILSMVYRRLRIENRGYWDRKARRQRAINVCKANGWWPESKGS